MLELNDGRSELWQWDTGRTLIVDTDCSQVHFSNNVFGRSIDVDVVGGVAIIPDILLQTDKDLNVWAFSGTAENGYTKISKTFKVNRRNKPADYVFTPADQTTLEQIQEKIDYLESIQDPDAIKNAVNDYLDQNPVEAPVQSVNGHTGAVKLTAKDVGAISRDDLQEATNKVLAQAKESGEFDGADGAPGQDGITPTIGDNGNWYLGDTDTGKPSRGEEGPQGPRGPQGEPGPAGSDATVTAENIQSALGYTPANSADLADKLPKSPTDWEQWTADEQAAARERIAADGAWQCVTLTADDYDAENHRFLIDAGEGRKFTEVYGIGQVVTDTPADADLTVGIGFGNTNNTSQGCFGNYSIKATNTQTSFSFDGKSIDFTSVKSDTYSQLGTIKYNTSKSTASNFYVDANMGNAANVRSMIYWRNNNPRYFSIFGLWDNVTWAAINVYIKLR